MDSRGKRARANNGEGRTSFGTGQQQQSSATKLPLFPAKKNAQTLSTKSPGKAHRDVDRLPDVPMGHGYKGRAADAGSSARSGAEQLARLGRQPASTAPGEDARDTRGFESPKLMEDRAQVARDEMRAYMQQRDRHRNAEAPAEEPQQHQGTKAAVGSTYERAGARDTSWDTDDTDAQRSDPRRKASVHDWPPAGERTGPAARAPAAPSTRAVDKLAQHSPDGEDLHSRRRAPGAAPYPAADRWPREEHRHQHQLDRDDRLRGADQSPTRHTPSRAAPSEGRWEAGSSSSLVRGLAPGEGPAPSPTVTPKAGHGASTTPTVARFSMSSVSRMSRVGLTDDAFEAFKQDVAAGVIQAHWRRWQAWKTQLRREAEERILRELLSDDTGLDLRLLLQVGGAAQPAAEAGDGASSGSGVRGSSTSQVPLLAPHGTEAANLEAEVPEPMSRSAAAAPGGGSGAFRDEPLGAVRRPWRAGDASDGGSEQGEGVTGQRAAASDASALPTIASVASRAAGLAGKVGRRGEGDSEREESRPVRPATAGSPLATTRRGSTAGAAAKSPGGGALQPRPRTAGGMDAGAAASPGARRAQTRGPAGASRGGGGQGRRSPGGAGAAGGKYGDSWADSDDESVDLHKVRVTPSKKHTGGHAVYTFVPTPRKQQLSETEQEEEEPEELERGGAAPHAHAAAAAQGSESAENRPAARGSAFAQHEREGDEQTQQRQPPDGEGRRAALEPPPGAPAAARAPSLDADSNPAMASPALSAATGGGATATPAAAAAATADDASSVRAGTAAAAPGALLAREAAPVHSALPPGELPGAADGARPGRVDGSSGRAAAWEQQPDGSKAPAAHPAEGRHVEQDVRQPPPQQQAQQARPPSPQRQSRIEALQRLRGMQSTARSSILSPRAPPPAAPAPAGGGSTGAGAGAVRASQEQGVTHGRQTQHRELAQQAAPSEQLRRSSAGLAAARGAERRAEEQQERSVGQHPRQRSRSSEQQSRELADSSEVSAVRGGLSNQQDMAEERWAQLLQHMPLPHELPLHQYRGEQQQPPGGAPDREAAPADAAHAPRSGGHRRGSEVQEQGGQARSQQPWLPGQEQPGPDPWVGDEATRAGVRASQPGGGFDDRSRRDVGRPEHEERSPDTHHQHHHHHSRRQHREPHQRQRPDSHEHAGREGEHAGAERRPATAAAGGRKAAHQGHSRHAEGAERWEDTGPGRWARAGEEGAHPTRRPHTAHAAVSPARHDDRRHEDRHGGHRRDVEGARRELEDGDHSAEADGEAWVRDQRPSRHEAGNASTSSSTSEKQTAARQEHRQVAAGRGDQGYGREQGRAVDVSRGGRSQVLDGQGPGAERAHQVRASSARSGDPWVTSDQTHGTALPAEPATRGCRSLSTPTGVQGPGRRAAVPDAPPPHGSGGSPGGAAAAGARAAQQQSPGAAGARGDAAQDRMTSILRFLDDAEQQAEQEATHAALVPMLLMGEASAGAPLGATLGAALGHTALAAGVAGVGAGAGGSSYTPRSGEGVRGGGGEGGEGLGRQSAAPVVPHAGSAGQPRPRTAQASLSQAALLQRSTAAAGEAHLPERRQRRATSPGAAAALEDDAVSLGGASNMSYATHGGRPAFLAESVYEGVRTKIRRLQDEVRERDTQIAELQSEVEALHAAQRAAALEADARLADVLGTQRAEYEAAVGRHLAFVDRLLADKDGLTQRVAQMAEQLKGAEERQERAISKLKEGWAAELRRQKDAWAAGEKQRRDAWTAAKAAEIKDVTVKGLEGEVQKLLARHKAELAAVQQAAADEARRHLDTYVAQNEVAVRQLKERLGREAEEAVEKERAAAATRLREVSERYEQQLQTQRMRLVADGDLRLEQLEQARKEEKRRYDEGLGAAKEAGEERVRELEEGWRREKEVLRKAHDKQIESLREQYETGQEGWRAAMAERARQEVEQRVGAIRDKLLQERNEEIEAVMSRLEAEHAVALERVRDESRRREEAAAARAAASIKEARRAEAKMAERFRATGLAAQAAEEKLAGAELAVQELRRELDSKNSTLRWLESQVSAAKEEAAARERDLRGLGAEKAAVAATAVAAVQREKEAVEARLAQAVQDQQELRAKHAAEMAHVEARVKATLARKDDTIAGLREQLAGVAAELRDTQAVLQQQQDELDELAGGGYE